MVKKMGNKIKEAKEKTNVLVEEMKLTSKIRQKAYKILDLNEGKVNSRPDSLGTAAIYLASFYTGERTDGSGEKITHKELSLYTGIPRSTIRYNSKKLSENCSMDVFL